MSFLGTVLGSLLVFGLMLWGTGLPIVRRLELPLAWRFACAPFAGALVLYGFSVGLHLAAAPVAAWRCLVVLGVLGWILERPEVARWMKDAEVRQLAAGGAGVALIATAWLAGVRNYSGGDWIGDWAGHFHRAQYFLHPQQDWSWMLLRDPIAGRPPLQNLVTSALLAIGGESFARYQVLTLLLGVLAWFPAALLLSTQPGGPSRALLAALTAFWVLNPMVVQNLIYPWTKTFTAAWVLLAIALARRALADTSAPPRLGPAAIAIGAGVLTHYSAVVYLVVLGPVVLTLLAQRSSLGGAIRQLLPAVGAMALLLASWFGWMLVQSGAAAITASTTTAQYLAESDNPYQLWQAWAENTVRTFLPHPLLPAADNLPVPAEPWAAWRDAWFQVYQTTLPFALGTPTLLLLCRSGVRRGWVQIARDPLTVVIVGLIALAIGVHTAPVRWGVAHIALQPLVLLALVWAAQSSLTWSPRVRRIVLALLAADALLGIALQARLQALSVSIEVLAMQDGGPLQALYGLAMKANAGSKHAFAYQFLGDMAPWPVAASGILALALAAWRWNRLRRATSPSLPSRVRP